MGKTSITCSQISNIPYNLNFTTNFNDSSIWITIISCDYLNLSLANEYVGDVTISTQVIKYNQNFLQADQPIGLQYSNQIKLFRNVQLNCHNDLIYINKETCKVLKNSNLKCRTSCTYKHFDEICQVKKGQNFFKNGLIRLP